MSKAVYKQLALQQWAVARLAVEQALQLSEKGALEVDASVELGLTQMAPAEPEVVEPAPPENPPEPEAPPADAPALPTADAPPPLAAAATLQEQASHALLILAQRWSMSYAAQARETFKIEDVATATDANLQALVDFTKQNTGWDGTVPTQTS